MSHSLETIYPSLPVWLQNLGLSLSGLAWRRERLGGDFEERVGEFQEREQWPASQMQAYVREELRRNLIAAFDQVPYYQRSWKAAGLGRGDLARMEVADLPNLPVTPKSALRESPTAFLAPEIARRHKLHYQSSSGATGPPLTVIYTSAGRRRFLAAREARSFAWAGTSLLKPRSIIGSSRVVPKGITQAPFHRYNWAERQVYFSADQISPDHLEDYMRAFNFHRPRVLTGYAYSHYLLARMLLEQGLSLDYEPDALVLSGEKLTGEMKSMIKRAFRARPYEEYGAVENCVLATECERGSFHVSSDFGIVEIVDPEGNPLPPGKEGRILCTGLLNEAQHLIRYDIGDLGILSGGRCPCGRNHLPLLQGIAGRTEEVVLSRKDYERAC